MKRMTMVCWILAGSIVYATLRYNVFNAVAWTNWPSFIINKALCLVAGIFLLLWAIHIRRNNPDEAVFWGRACMHAAGTHILLSLALLTPDYFGEKFFAESKMNLNGETMLLFGALCAYAFYQLKNLSTESSRFRLTLAALVFLLLHTGFIGYPSWLTPAKWPGGMPPISLLGFLLTAVSLGLFATKKTTG